MCPFPEIEEICLLKKVSICVSNVSVKSHPILNKAVDTTASAAYGWAGAVMQFG